MNAIKALLITCGLTLYYGSSYGNTPRNNVIREINNATAQLNINPELSAQLASEALKQSYTLGEDELVINSSLVLARAYHLLGSFDRCFETIFYIYDHYSAEQYPKYFAQISMRMSNLYRAIKDYDQALQYANQALELYQSLNDSIGIASYYNTRGMIESHVGQLDKAELSLNEALGIFRRLGSELDVARVLNNLALYETPHNRKKIGQLKESLSLNKKNGNRWAMAENYNNLATHYFYLQEYHQATMALDSARTIALSLNARELICDNYRYQSWVDYGQKNYKAAHDNLLKVYEIEEKLLSEKLMRNTQLAATNKKIEQQQAAAELNQKQHELEILKRNMTILGISFVVLALFFIYITVTRKQRKRMERLNQKITIEAKEKEILTLSLQNNQTEKQATELMMEHQKREMINLSFHIHNRTEILGKIKEMVKQTTKMPESEVTTNLKRILSFINQYQNKDNEIKELTQHIDDICSEFSSKLKKLHPELTKNELQLASFLRINMSSKEISLFSGTSEKSINMARYRLRKHFSLTNDVRLNDYLKSI